MKTPSTTRLARALIVGQNPMNDERKTKYTALTARKEYQHFAKQR